MFNSGRGKGEELENPKLKQRVKELEEALKEMNEALKEGEYKIISKDTPLPTTHPS